MGRGQRLLDWSKLEDCRRVSLLSDISVQGASLKAEDQLFRAGGSLGWSRRGHPRAEEKVSPQTLRVSLGKEEFASSLAPGTIEAFQAAQARSIYPPSSVIFVEGQASAGVYVLHKGRVRLSGPASIARNSSPRIVGPGEILCLSATLSGKAHEVTAETLAPSEVGFIKRDDFLDFMYGHGDFTFGVLRLLSAELGSSLEQVRSLRRGRPRKAKSWRGNTPGS